MLEPDNPETEQLPPPTLGDLATLRQRPVIYLSGDMDHNSVGWVQDVAPYFEEFRRLSILLNSFGGDIDSAYRMVLALRETVEDIEVLVPYWAKSAATFFCLAADSIHIGRYGELGPLDPQRFDRTGSDRPVSSLESFKSLEHLLEYSLESLNGIIGLLQTIAPMDIPYAIDRSHQLFAAIVSPLYSQVDPHELGESGRSLSVSQAYAIRVMERWGYADRTENERMQIANRLILDYPTHGFVIDLHEAQAIGLNAEPMEAVSDAICRAIVTNDKYDEIIGFPQEVGEDCSISLSNIESCDEE